MIRAEFFSRDGIPAGFCISGHAGDAGTDIVCAAVSSAAYLTANTATDIVGAEAGVRISDGRMSFRVAGKEAAKCRDLLRGLEAHLTALRRQYPEKIDVIHTEV